MNYCREKNFPHMSSLEGTSLPLFWQGKNIIFKLKNKIRVEIGKNKSNTRWKRVAKYPESTEHWGLPSPRSDRQYVIFQLRSGEAITDPGAIVRPSFSRKNTLQTNSMDDRGASPNSKQQVLCLQAISTLGLENVIHRGHSFQLCCVKLAPF